MRVGWCGEARTASCSCHSACASCKAEPFGACEHWRRECGVCVERSGGASATAASGGLGWRGLGGSCADSAHHSNTQQSSQAHKCVPHCTSGVAGWR